MIAVHRGAFTIGDKYLKVAYLNIPTFNYHHLGGNSKHPKMNSEVQGSEATNITIESAPNSTISFKQHLENSANLIYIFAALNAVLLFANQSTKVDAEGAQMIGISMYILSLFVLWEIIWQTVNAGVKSFKFQAFYFLICIAEIGFTTLFLKAYETFVYSLLAIIAFFGVFWVIGELVSKLTIQLITEKNVDWWKGKTKAVTFIMFLISIFSTGILFYFSLPLIHRLIVTWSK